MKFEIADKQPLEVKDHYYFAKQRTVEQRFDFLMELISLQKELPISCVAEPHVNYGKKINNNVHIK
jgi:hypothetical protein